MLKPIKGSSREDLIGYIRQIEQEINGVKLLVKGVGIGQLRFELAALDYQRSKMGKGIEREFSTIGLEREAQSRRYKQNSWIMYILQQNEHGKYVEIGLEQIMTNRQDSLF